MVCRNLTSAHGIDTGKDTYDIDQRSAGRSLWIRAKMKPGGVQGKKGPSTLNLRLIP
jgi:hypothetical protein